MGCVTRAAGHTRCGRGVSECVQYLQVYQTTYRGKSICLLDLNTMTSSTCLSFLRVRLPADIGEIREDGREFPWQHVHVLSRDLEDENQEP